MKKSTSTGGFLLTLPLECGITTNMKTKPNTQKPSEYVRVTFLAYFPVTESIGASRWFDTYVFSNHLPPVMREDAAAQLREIYGEDAKFEIQLFRVL